MGIGLRSEVRPQLNNTETWVIVETGGAWEKTMCNKWFFEGKQMIVLYYKDFHTWKKNVFFLSKNFLHYKNTLLFLLSFFKIMRDPIQMTFYDFTFRSEANGNCLFSAFSIAMCRDNRYVNHLRILTGIDLYVNPGFYSQHPTFTLLLNNNPGVFNSIDTILPISFSHNALDTNKTKGELVQRETLNICSAYRWCGFLCVLALS